MADRRNAVRRALLQQWLDEHERSLAWAARQIGTTRFYLSDVMRGKRNFTDGLARRLQDTLGLSFDYRDTVNEEDAEALEPAAVS